MRAVKNEFPNPVLANSRDDYIDSCSFGTIIDAGGPSVDPEAIVIPISYSLKSKNLNALIDNGSAVVVVTIRSSAASFSRVEKFPKDSTKIEIRIPKESVIRKIELIGSVIATKPIEKFECEEEFDPLYFGSQTFEIRKGDTLACEDSKFIDIDDSELEKPISSIFIINCVDDQTEDIIPYFYDEKIRIDLKSELFYLYDSFKDYNNGSLTRYINGIIVYPVLVEALTRIQANYRRPEDEQEDYELEEKRWFKAIELKAEKLDIHLEGYQDSVVTLADKLLGEISLGALKSFQDIFESEINNGETTNIGGVD